MDKSDDQVTLTLLHSIEYRMCFRCGETTITLLHRHTMSRIEIDPLPHPEGTIFPEFEAGRCFVVPLKRMKNYPQLWRAHVASCKEVK